MYAIQLQVGRNKLTAEPNMSINSLHKIILVVPAIIHIDTYLCMCCDIMDQVFAV